MNVIRTSRGQVICCQSSRIVKKKEKEMTSFCYFSSVFSISIDEHKIRYVIMSHFLLEYQSKEISVIVIIFLCKRVPHAHFMLLNTFFFFTVEYQWAGAAYTLVLICDMRAGMKEGQQVFILQTRIPSSNF